MPLTWITTPQDIFEMLQVHFFQRHNRMPDSGVHQDDVPNGPRAGTPVKSLSQGGKETASLKLQSIICQQLINDRNIQIELARMIEEGIDYEDLAHKALHMIEAELIRYGKLSAPAQFADPERLDKLLFETEDDFDLESEGPPE